MLSLGVIPQVLPTTVCTVVFASKMFFPGKFTVQYDAQVFHLVSSDQLLAMDRPLKCEKEHLLSYA